MPGGGSIILRTQNIFLEQDYCINSPFDLEPGEFIELSVSDTGSGIPQQFMDKIFNPFFTTKEIGKGTGLGLSMVYGTVRDHKGSITVVSELNKGTTFHILLPCSSRQKETHTDSQTVDPNWKVSGTVLLVDDEAVIRHTCKLLLEQIGFKVILGTNGKEALELYSLHQNEIKLIISDMIMPEMNGHELFDKLMEIDSSCPIILSSGFSENEDLLAMKKRD